MRKILVLPILLVALTGWGKSDLDKGKAAFQQGDGEKAVKFFSQAIESNSQDKEAYFFRGATFSAVGEFDKALTDYSHAIQIDPNYADAYWSRGYCYANRGEDIPAIADYTKALELDAKQKTMIYELRASSYFRKSRLDDAEADLKSLLSLEPKNQNALRGLAAIIKAKSSPDFDPHALKYRPVEEQPNYGEEPLSPGVLEANKKFVEDVSRSYETQEAAVAEGLTIAWQMFHRGDFETAMKRFNQVWLLTPENPEIFFGYARVLKAWGYAEEAAHWTQKAKAGGYDVPDVIP